MKRETDLKCRSKGRPGLAGFVARVRNVAAISGRYSMELWLFLLSSINSCFPELWKKPLGKPSSSSVLFCSRLGSLFASGSRKCCFKFSCQRLLKRDKQTNKKSPWPVKVLILNHLNKWNVLWYVRVTIHLLRSFTVSAFWLIF